MKRYTNQRVGSAPQLWAMRLLSVAAPALLVLCGVFQSAHAQAVYGSIFGTVTDNGGAVIPNATVKITDVPKGTSITVQTNGSGDYTAQHLIPDVYQVEVTAAGFSPAKLTMLSSMRTQPPRPMSN